MLGSTDYIIDITDEIRSAFADPLRQIAHDLSEIKRLEPRVKNIVLRGGAVVDLLMGLPPNDYDLFYSFEEDGAIIKECRCADVKKAVEAADLHYIDSALVDLENSYEKEPFGEPTERTCGLISFHTTSFNMYTIDHHGRVWTNRETWAHFQAKVCEIRYEGMLPWAYFPRPGDSNDYFASICHEIIRALGYMIKRDLTPGPKLIILLEHAPYFAEQGIIRQGKAGFAKQAEKKHVTAEGITKVVAGLQLDEPARNNLTQALTRLCGLS